MRTFQQLIWPTISLHPHGGSVLIHAPTASAAHRCDTCCCSCVVTRSTKGCPKCDVSSPGVALLCRVAQFLAGQGLGCGVLTEEQSAEEAGRTSAAFAGGELQVCGYCGRVCPCLVAFDKLALIVSCCANPWALTPTIDTNSAGAGVQRGSAGAGGAEERQGGMWRSSCLPAARTAFSARLLTGKQHPLPLLFAAHHFPAASTRPRAVSDTAQPAVGGGGL